MGEFSSFAGFAAHLALLAAVQETAQHEVLEHAADLIETRARAKIGEYQSQTGPFSAWAELADSTKQDRSNQGYPADQPGLRSGEMRESIEHRANGQEAHVGSDNDNLLWFELGTVRQPARSVLGGSAFELAPKIVEETGVALTSVLSGGSTKLKI